MSRIFSTLTLLILSFILAACSADTGDSNGLSTLTFSTDMAGRSFDYPSNWIVESDANFIKRIQNAENTLLVSVTSLSQLPNGNTASSFEDATAALSLSVRVESGFDAANLQTLETEGEAEISWFEGTYQSNPAIAYIINTPSALSPFSTIVASSTNGEAFSEEIRLQLDNIAISLANSSN